MGRPARLDFGHLAGDVGGDEDAFLKEDVGKGGDPAFVITELADLVEFATLDPSTSLGQLSTLSDMYWTVAFSVLGFEAARPVSAKLMAL